MAAAKPTLPPQSTIVLLGKIYNLTSGKRNAVYRCCVAETRSWPYAVYPKVAKLETVLKLAKCVPGRLQCRDLAMNAGKITMK